MTTPVLAFEQVGLRFPALSRPVLDDIDYTIYQHDFIIVLGANGSGKSSLLKLIDGRYKTSHGHIKLHHKKINTASYGARARHISTLTQRSRDNLFSQLTVLENCKLRQHKQDEATLLAHLEQFNPNLVNKLSTLVSQLSGGEQQALALALIMLHPPEIILLDEHTSALDPNTAKRLMALTAKIIQQHRITAILTTHNVEHALAYGNRILALKEGKLHTCIEKSQQAHLDANMLLAQCY